MLYLVFSIPIIEHPWLDIVNAIIKTAGRGRKMRTPHPARSTRNAIAALRIKDCRGRSDIEGFIGVPRSIRAETGDLFADAIRGFRVNIHCGCDRRNVQEIKQRDRRRYQIQERRRVSRRL